jgi:hypothetical protein
VIHEYPFAAAPDAFILDLQEKAEGISFSFFETPWGVTDECLCYYRGTLIGQVGVKDSKLMISNGRAVISLLPNLDRIRRYEWPSAEEFSSAVVELLTHTQSWTLHCERDCDQYPVEHLRNDIPKTLARLSQALGYCSAMSAECPAFSSTYVQAPNPSIERDVQGLSPSAAPHVKR